jgi:hypothetical protein
MAQQKLLSRLGADTVGAEAIALPPVTVRVVGAVLALAVATAHVADQGGVTAFTFPDWLGWSYRLIEMGGVLVALMLMWPRSARLGWAAGVLLGAGPFVGYIASRTVGVPGDAADVGNWGDWVGTLALIIEAGLIMISVGMLWALRRRPLPTDISETPTAQPPLASADPGYPLRLGPLGGPIGRM